MYYDTIAPNGDTIRTFPDGTIVRIPADLNADEIESTTVPPGGWGPGSFGDFFADRFSRRVRDVFDNVIPDWIKWTAGIAIIGVALTFVIRKTK